MRERTEQIQKWADQLNQFGRQEQACFFLVDFEQQQPRVWPMDSPELPRFDFPRRPDPLPLPVGLTRPRLSAQHIQPATFRTAFDIVQQGLHRGDSFLTNLTFPVPITLNGNLTDVYHHSQAKYRILLPGKFTCFSPETFVTVSPTGYLESRPMKGTTLDTLKARQHLLNSRKEIAEHATIVDLIRNDLSRVARNVRVTDYRYFHKISTSRRGLVQTSSNVGGQLGPKWNEHLGDTLLSLLPAGSVSGAPKEATLAIIRRAEGQGRGYYCGVGGYFDGRRLDTCVMIRFIERAAEGNFLFRSGGGITARSDWQSEYEELKTKVRIPLKG